MQTYFLLSLFLTPVFIVSLQTSFLGNDISVNTHSIESTIEPPLSDYQKRVLELQNWERPNGPIKIALQAGHWQRENAPDEFPNLANNTGASAAGVNEVDLNLKIAREVQSKLEEKGFLVDVLPATIPPDYYADIFIAIHGDGSPNTAKNGFKSSEARFDYTGKGKVLSQIMDEEYKKATGLAKDPNISRNMLYYYAFNWYRYEHALHPMTVGIIFETGFISNPSDRYFLTNNTIKSVDGLTNGILAYIDQSELTTSASIE